MTEFRVVPLRCGHSLRLRPPPTKRDRHGFYCVSCDIESWRDDLLPPEWHAVCILCTGGNRPYGQDKRGANHAANMHNFRTGHPVTVEYLSALKR